ncbi:MAG: hypothetical protein US75_C0018G0003 [Candidatus Woesebacteria bacterium GW2011_GWC1_38_13]|uniref:Uncharacterized protein n=4 Tax=Candidatus Woeseibacteriota TaxID=1752722 RepID=A0A0G0KXW2_9BACT|nr:MAG: hypothetical protein US67_C0041G0005 [Candidatus Woesebacteria bacterium GW2011_GWD1_38_10]KKQ55575.1 MAG: hypothetical protein US75_C0018G0003 [Candidatus Woesebacteria bacterium GW2011_GWC1_38_13]KKQ84468.1 MAG: hypothetical protein UT06_C0004G0004 [Candidatus Woesebacteria bacterium GW2011_GWA1_38_8]
MTEDNKDQLKFSKSEPKTLIFTGSLFHGSKNPFLLDTNYAYDGRDENQGDGSATIGTGLYLTDDTNCAEDYSLVRQASRGTPSPNIYQFDLREAKMLDFRAPDLNNVAVPKQFVQKWLSQFPDRFQIFVNSEKQRISPRVYRIKRENGDKYSKYLEQLAEHDDIDLREMLATGELAKNHKDVKPISNYPNPPWMKIFREFVQTELDYDGLIYYEGSEGTFGKKTITSYVLFDLDKVQSYGKLPNTE